MGLLTWIAQLMTSLAHDINQSLTVYANLSTQTKTNVAPLNVNFDSAQKGMACRKELNSQTQSCTLRSVCIQVIECAGSAITKKNVNAK